jgi:NAD(P)-dependent dehydrogenase (short-subunit alcohol dehydrogenase family)
MSKNVVVTGANRGIGLALTKQFLSRGYQVYALCRQSSEQLSGTTAVVIENVDVATDEGLSAMVDGLAGIKVDVLICNAGILRDEGLGRLNNETIVDQFMVNSLAPINVVDRLLSQLATGSKIAMITSRMGSIADNGSGGRYGYRMSKAALNAASMSLAKDLANDEISVGIYHPGYVQTDMVNHGGDISADVCAERLTNLIEQQSMADTGVFKHSNGEILPW